VTHELLFQVNMLGNSILRCDNISEAVAGQSKVGLEESKSSLLRGRTASPLGEGVGDALTKRLQVVRMRSSFDEKKEEIDTSKVDAGWNELTKEPDWTSRTRCVENLDEEGQGTPYTPATAASKATAAERRDVTIFAFVG